MNDSVITAEKYFVDTFVRKDRRERLWYELSHPNRRYRGLSRFCHQSTDLLRPDINEAGIAQKYYDYRSLVYLRMAEEWCQDHKVRYTRKA